MQVFRNTAFTRRDYECTNIVAARAEQSPGEHWAEADPSILEGLTMLHIQAGVEYWGYL